MHIQEFYECFQQKRNWFLKRGKTFYTELLHIKKNFPPHDCQTKQTKSSSQPTNLLGTKPFNETSVTYYMYISILKCLPKSLHLLLPEYGLK